MPRVSIATPKSIAATSVGRLAGENSIAFRKWRNSPSGLSAMGFGRVSVGPHGGNEHLQALIDEKASKEAAQQVTK